MIKCNLLQKVSIFALIYAKSVYCRFFIAKSDHSRHYHTYLHTINML